jgi:hypothetical protein
MSIQTLEELEEEADSGGFEAVRGWGGDYRGGRDKGDGG